MLEICLTNRAGMIQEEALEHAFVIPNLGSITAARNRARFLLDYTNKGVAWGFFEHHNFCRTVQFEQQTIREVAGHRPQ